MIRLMFVDDETRVIDGMRRAMHGMRHEWSIRFATSGADALQQLASEPADVVVSDMRMPEMDGSQLLDQVMRLYPQAIRFILSGQSETEASIRATRTAHRYLSKPCSAGTLQAAIQRTTKLKALLNNDALAAIVGSVDTLPTPPGVYLRLRERLADADGSVTDIVQVLENDVGLTARVVKVANSGFFGGRNPVQSIDRAVAFLGMDLVASIVLGKELYDANPGNVDPAFDLDRLSRHSFRTALWARAIALHEDLGAAFAERAFLSGVLHDVGHLIFASRAMSANPAQTGVWRQDSSLQLTRPHAAAGAYLLGLWAFPEDLVEAVLWHHRPGQSGESGLGLSGLLHVGDLLAHRQEQAMAPAERADADRQRPTEPEPGYLESIGMADHWQAWCELRPSADALETA